jgi:single-stranded DNA-specific DHH superfamily exonuclease
VGRGTRASQASDRRRQAKEPVADLNKPQGMDIDSIFAQFAAPPEEQEPDWRLPNEFFTVEAQQFCSAGAPGGLQIDPAVALRLLKLDYEGNFHAYRRWYQGDKSLIAPPEKTVPGMLEAGQELAKAIDRGDKIAVFCDYDVDGTAAGEVLRRGLEAYQPDLLYGRAEVETGFGLTNEFVQHAADSGAKMLITLDCGSGQADQIALAQKLGMKVIVVDHHEVADNPAEYHLNPQLYDPPSSHNTGAQLSWKLAAAVQQAKENKTRAEHWQTPLQLAGMGCLADMGSVVLPENRAFFWAAHEHPSEGVRALAKELEEDPETPGQMVRTQAVLNLPKRTSKITGDDVAAILAAKSPEEAKPYVDKALQVYEEAQPAKEAMQKEALSQTGEAEVSEDGEVNRSKEDELFAVAVLEDYQEFAGYTGPVASNISRKTKKPGVVFAYKGVDEHGQKLYKFSSRDESTLNQEHKLGQLIQDEPMRSACTIKVEDQDGHVKEVPVLGGHAEVVSGVCTEDKLPEVVKAMEGWAERKSGKNNNRFYKPPWDGPDAFLSERKVSGDRLADIEKQAARLGPFSRQKQLSAPQQKGKQDRLANNSELQISVVGELSLGELDPDNDAWRLGELKLDNGQTRSIHYPADAKDHSGSPREWVLRVSGGGEYWLRLSQPVRD